jgi:pimeloyl-ACP methyl ester carboxylesterase
MKSIAKRVSKFLGVVLLLVAVLFGYNVLRFMVFWAPSEEVAFESEPGVTIRGTLVKPAGDGNFPAVVMLHGAGPEERDGPGYRVLSNAIVRSGVAVLLYDKRGVGESDGDFESALYADFVADAMAAVRYLASRDDIDAGNIGVHGNSEGGWFTPEIAYRTGQVAYIFNRVGPPLSWIDNVIWEVRNDLLAAGVPAESVEPLLDNTKRRWEYYIAAGSDPSLAHGPVRDAIDEELKRLVAATPAALSELPAELPPYDPKLYADYAANFGYDPGPFLEAIDIPMIYTFGKNDINVPTEDSVAFLESFRKEFEKDIRIEAYDGVGHYMAGWTGLLSGGYIPPFVKTLEDWYSAQAVR